MTRITALSALGVPGRNSLIVADHPAVAAFTWQAWDLTVTFHENTADPDDLISGIGGGPTAYVDQFLWDFGDGNTSTERHPQHTYASPNTYSVTLTATNPAMVSASVSHNVVVAAVANHAPFASFTYSVNGLIVQFTDTSEDDDGTIASWSWNFGDAATSTLQNPSRTYAATGAYTVTLTVTDDDATTNVVTQTIYVGSAYADYPVAQDNWPMAGANVQRHNTNSQEVWDGDNELTPRWYVRFERDELNGRHSYIPYWSTPIIYGDIAYMTTSGGIIAVDLALGNEGAEVWRYAMALPPGHMPTYHGGYLYIPGTDRRLHVVNATTGAFVRTYATGGMITSNPLVLDSDNSSATQPIAIFGCRDGLVYAVYAEGAPSPGTLAWSTDLGAPISHSAAYYEDHIYIGAKDSKLRRIAINDGAVAHTSATQPGFAVDVWWPVIVPYAGGARVIVSGGSMQRHGLQSAGMPGIGMVQNVDIAMYSTLGYSTSRWLGNIASPLDDAGADYVDGADVATWHGTTHPNERTYHHFYADDLTDAEILPLLWTGTESGWRYPPAVNYDGKVYFWGNVKYLGGSIPQAMLVRWTPANPTRLYLLEDSTDAADEPRSWAIGGRYLHELQMGNRAFFSHDLVNLTLTEHWDVSHPQRGGSIGFFELVPNGWGGGYASSDHSADGNYEAYDGLDSPYGTVGHPGPPICHRGRVYTINSNTLVCVTKGDHAPALEKTAIAAIDTSTAVVQPVTLSTAAITSKLQAHVQAMLDDYDDTGDFLRPAFVPAGLAGIAADNNNAYLGDPYSMPSETVYALLRAYPHLSGAQQTALATYIAAFHTAYPVNTREFLPWEGLSDRSYGLLYPTRLKLTDGTFDTALTTRGFQPVDWGTPNPDTGVVPILWQKNPFAWYALWQMHDILGTTASTLISGANANLTAVVNPANMTTDANLTNAPYVLNAYISGYIGFINLKAAAASALVNGEQAELDRLMALRRDLISAGAAAGQYTQFGPYATANAYTYYSDNNVLWRNRHYNLAFQFLWMVPELWEYLYDEIPDDMEDIATHHASVIPYWHVRLFPVGYNEEGVSNVHNANLLVQAHARAGLYNQQQLSARIDDPAFKLGDYDYINSLVTALEMPAVATLSIDTVVDAVTTYNNGGTTERKVTVTVTVTTPATEPWFEYDASVPTGVEAETGCTVNLIVQAPNDTTYTVPMYWVQEYTHTTHANTLIGGNPVHDHLLPASDAYAGSTHTYKGHFTPTATGDWDYYVSATDAGGSVQSATDTVSIPAIGAGLIRVSPTDTRYFEYSNGTLFLPSGYTQQDIEALFHRPSVYGDDAIADQVTAGVNFSRFWASYASVYGSAQNGIATRLPATDPPQTVIRNNTTKADRTFFWQIQPVNTDEEFHTNGIVVSIVNQGHLIACEPSTEYEVTVTYQLEDAFTSAGAGDYGLVIKTTSSSPSQANIVSNAYGTPISSHVTSGTPGAWTTLVGTYTTAAGQYFFPWTIIGIENAVPIDPPSGDATNRVHISDIEIRKSSGGPNLLAKFKADMHRYFDQQKAAAFDYILGLCEENGLYLSLVTLEKNDNLLQRLHTDGTATTTASVNHFYGNSTDVDHHGRWYQKQWWRYCQARWGYSAAIHSWELLNEGHASAIHYRQADVLAGYINQWTLNRHLITTSFFDHRAYDRSGFWNSATYTNISAAGRTFVSTHDYIDDDETGWADEPAAIADIEAIFAVSPNMPVGSGETDWTTDSAVTTDIDATNNAVWAHNVIWSSLLSGKLAFVLLWYVEAHLYPSGSDQRAQFAAARAFLAGLPLNNGEYEDIGVTTANLTVVGQKDLTNGRAHFWVQAHGANPYTWKSIDDSLTITPVTEDITIPGLTPSQEYIVTEYSVVTGAVTANTDTLTADGSGNLVIPTASFASLVGINDTAAFRVEEGESGPEPEPEGESAMRNFRAELVHFSATRRFDTEDVVVSSTRRFDTDDVYAVATRRFSAKEVYATPTPRRGTRKVYIVGSES